VGPSFAGSIIAREVNYSYFLKLVAALEDVNHWL